MSNKGYNMLMYLRSGNFFAAAVTFALNLELFATLIKKYCYINAKI